MKDIKPRRKFLKGAALGATAAAVAVGVTSCTDDKAEKMAMEEAAALKTQLKAAHDKITELESPAVMQAEPVLLKMQAAWGGGIFLENANAYVNRVNEMAGGALQIELLPVNAVVKTSQMQDAVHRGVLDLHDALPISQSRRLRPAEEAAYFN